MGEHEIEDLYPAQEDECGQSEEERAGDGKNIRGGPHAESVISSVVDLLHRGAQGGISGITTSSYRTSHILKMRRLVMSGMDHGNDGGRTPREDNEVVVNTSISFRTGPYQKREHCIAIPFAIP